MPRVSIKNVSLYSFLDVMRGDNCGRTKHSFKEETVW